MYQLTDITDDLKALDSLDLAPSYKKVLAEILIREADPTETTIFTYMEVAEQLGLNRNTVSLAVRHLAAEGYISRNRTPGNAYSHRVNLDFVRARARQIERELQADSERARASLLPVFSESVGRA